MMIDLLYHSSGMANKAARLKDIGVTNHLVGRYRTPLVRDLESSQLDRLLAPKRPLIARGRGIPEGPQPMG
jgi:hypothetical protein